MKKYIFTILFLVTLLITPVLAEVDVKCIGGAEGEKCGQTGTSSVDLIANLRAQIATLTTQLNQLLAQQRGGFCYDFNKDIKLGDSGTDDIKNFQKALIIEDVIAASYADKNSDISFFEYKSGYVPVFADETSAAAKKFQAKYNIPNTGYVGPLTRAKLNELYGCNKKVFITPESLQNAQLPKEYAPNGQPSGNYYSAHLKSHGFRATDVITWTVVNGTLPPGLNLRKSIPPASPATNGAPVPESYYIQTEADISGWPTIAGTYAFTVQATDGTQIATQNYTLVVKAKDESAPIISSISGPTSLKVGEMGTWTVKASDPNKGNLSYSVLWGDEGCYGMNSVVGVPSSYNQSTTITHAYNCKQGTYRPVFTVTNSGGKTAQTSISVEVGDIVQSPITVTSPNGGETWMASSTEDIKWTWVGAKRTDKVDIYLIQDWSCPPGLACAAVMPEPILLDKNISARATYHWFVGSEINSNAITIPLGKYRVQVCPAGKEVWSNDCDSSDQLFSINLPLINDAL